MRREHVSLYYMHNPCIMFLCVTYVVPGFSALVARAYESVSWYLVHVNKMLLA